MSDKKEGWPNDYDENMVKCLTLSSGEKIITYVRDITALGSYICERPFTVNINLEDGSFCLLQYQPYARNESVHIFQTFGVIGMVDVSDYGRTQYLEAVKSEVEFDKKYERNSDRDFNETIQSLQKILEDALGEDSETMKELFGDLDERSGDSPSTVIDLSKWKVDDDTSKN